MFAVVVRSWDYNTFKWDHLESYKGNPFHSPKSYCYFLLRLLACYDTVTITRAGIACKQQGNSLNYYYPGILWSAALTGKSSFFFSPFTSGFGYNTSELPSCPTFPPIHQYKNIHQFPSTSYKSIAIDSLSSLDRGTNTIGLWRGFLYFTHLAIFMNCFNCTVINATLHWKCLQSFPTNIT